MMAFRTAATSVAQALPRALAGSNASITIRPLVPNRSFSAAKAPGSDPLDVLRTECHGTIQKHFGFSFQRHHFSHVVSLIPSCFRLDKSVARQLCDKDGGRLPGAHWTFSIAIAHDDVNRVRSIDAILFAIGIAQKHISLIKLHLIFLKLFQTCAVKPRRLVSKRWELSVLVQPE